MRALWSDRPNCSHNVSQKVKRIRCPSYPSFVIITKSALHAVAKRSQTCYKINVSGNYSVPSQPKLLQKNSLQRKCFGAINFVKITKESLYKANSLACFVAKRDTPVAATLQKKSSGGIIFVIITKIITKENVPRNYFVIISARMVMISASMVLT